MPAPPAAFRLGAWLVDPQRNRLVGTAGEVVLQSRVMDLLVHLASRASKVVSKQELAETVWSDAVVGDEALTTAVWELRRALGDEAKAPRFIATVRGRGYRLLVGPTPIDRPPGPPVNGPTPEVAPSPIGAALVMIAMGIVMVLLGGPLGEAPAPPPDAESVAPGAWLERAEALVMGDRDWVAAERSLERARELAPRDPRVHQRLALLHALLGRDGPALEHLRLALGGAGESAAGQVRVLYLLGRFEAASRRGRRGLRRHDDPGLRRATAMVELMRGDLVRARMLVAEGDFTEAEDLVLGLLLAAAEGRQPAARERLVVLAGMTTDRFLLALGHGAVGEVERALAIAHEAAMARDPAAVRLATDPLCGVLLGGPGFDRYRHSLGLPERTMVAAPSWARDAFPKAGSNALR